MSDVVFLLKLPATPNTPRLSWPRAVRIVPLDPPADCMCGGTDPRCSTAYSCFWRSLQDASGRALPNLLRRYAPSATRVAFVGFSASHGFLNPLARNDADRREIDAYILLDATFGGAKDGYARFAADAADGDRLMVSATSNTGGDQDWMQVWQAVTSATGKQAKRVPARGPMPEPSGGAWKLGSLMFYLRYVDARGGSELPHTKMHTVMDAALSAYLIPYWRGELTFPWLYLAAGAGAAAAGYAAWQSLRASK